MIQSPSIVVYLVFLVFVRASLGNDENRGAFTDPSDTPLAFEIQGEYVGSVGGDAWGAQVIATSHREFRAIGFRGGLPGDGWTKEPGQYLSGKLDGNTVEMLADEFSIRVDGRTLNVYDSAGSELGALQKVNRKSKTLGRTPPEDAEVLFAGKSTAQWHNAKIVGDQWLAATGCYTKQKWDDHQLHLEFRTPFMPRASGQGRGNSGVYVQSRYEVQVLDSFGLASKDNECGGIYQIAKPKVNMCYPPLSWQTYDIDFTAAKWKDGQKVVNARITVKHNGVTIHQNLELPNHTPGRQQESAQPAPLFLQDHGNPVVFRNIWIVNK